MKTTIGKMHKKQRRDQRSKQPRRMQLTERDKAIIQAVYEYRVLRQDQLQQLFFGTKSAAQRVLFRLYQHGFLERKFLPVLQGRSPTMYVLDRRGVELLRTEFGYDELQWHPGMKDLKTEFLAHTAGINTFRIAVTVAAKQEGYELVKWLGENDLKADYDRVNIRQPNGKVLTVSLIPDSYFILKTPNGYAHFFLELDRGTMTGKRFRTKILSYIAYATSALSQQRYGTNRFRVLTVTESQRRRENLKTATEGVEGKSRFWFGVLSELTPSYVLSFPVWSVAGREEQVELIS
jgi:predicted transcriptional regulator